MNPDRWQRLSELCAECEALAPEHRRRHLEERCPDDPELVEEALRILASSEQTGFLEPPERAHGAAILFGSTLDGTRVGDFELVREIGRGGMGVVYLARQTSLGRTVAVKLLPRLRAENSREVDRFRMEARAASSLQHQSIAPVLAYGEEQGFAWYAMGYVEGHDLHREICLQRGEGADGADAKPILPPFDSPEYIGVVMRRVAELAEALQHAHDKGVIHRDIKPQNILLTPEGLMVLADFGLAKDASMGSITRSSEVRGTLFYMSPEQARALRAPVDHRTDIYSLSVVLYELLTLRKPFDGHSQLEVLAKIAKSRAPNLRRANSRVPNDLIVVCEKAMDKVPGYRYSSARSFGEDLQRILRHEAIMAKPQSVWRRAYRFGERHAIACSAAAALGIAIPSVWLASQAHAQYKLLPRISVVTEPPGANVRLVPLDPVTGNALEDSEELHLGRSPLEEMRVPPGAYLLVAADDSGAARAEQAINLLEQKEVFRTPLLYLREEPMFDLDLVEIARGRFRMERPLDENASASQQSYPTVRHAVLLHPFLAGKYEVTNAQYRAFLLATGHKAPVQWPKDWRDVWPPEWDDLPVAFVMATDAEAFCGWAGVRLLSGIEWERAARSADERELPWDSESRDLTFAHFLANVREQGKAFEVSTVGGSADHERQWQQYLQYAKPVGSFPQDRSPDGLYDVAGNVGEWTSSLTLGEHSPGVWIYLPTSRITKGGSWKKPALLGFDSEVASDARTGMIGFRVGRSILAAR